MKEVEIRPTSVFDEYLKLSAEDIPLFFSKVVSGEGIAVDCVACGSTNHRLSFKKLGFKYSSCIDCNTLFASERPSEKAYEQFYKSSASASYWAKKFSTTVAEVRREKIIRPNALKITKIAEEHGFDPHVKLCDIGGGYGIFAEEWKRENPSSQVTIVEPGQELVENCRKRGMHVIESKLETVPVEHHNAYQIVTCFEVIEHAYAPLDFIKSAYNLVSPGGIAVITGLGVEGFDIQILWEKSKSISPPHHINFMSVKGFQELFKRAGFKKVTVTTPGKLDVDIVSNHLSSCPEDSSLLSRFENLCLERGEEFQKDFQSLLSKHSLSSHCWIIAEK